MFFSRIIGWLVVFYMWPDHTNRYLVDKLSLIWETGRFFMFLKFKYRFVTTVFYINYFLGWVSCPFSRAPLRDVILCILWSLINVCGCVWFNLFFSPQVVDEILFSLSLSSIIVLISLEKLLVYHDYLGDVLFVSKHLHWTRWIYLVISRCVICQMEYKRKDQQVTLPCKHVYHAGCGSRWLSINKVINWTLSKLFPSIHHFIYTRLLSHLLMCQACPICYTEVVINTSKRWSK